LFQQLIVSTNPCLNKSLFRHEEHFVEETSPWKKWYLGGGKYAGRKTNSFALW
jgi:hypothetical protein